MYNIYGVVNKLKNAGVKYGDIGIITPYNSQKLKLQFEKFYHEKFNDLKIESVDGFQGMEKEYIIISAVRSNVFGYIGFVNSPKRLNVSLTRAKRGLIILGNAECLCKRNGIWRDLIQFYHNKKLIVQGQLDNLEQISDKELNIEDIDEDEGLIDEKDFEEDKMDKLLNLDKQTSSDLAWGMGDYNSKDDYDIDEEEEEEIKDKIIGLNLKNENNKKEKQSSDDEDE